MRRAALKHRRTAADRGSAYSTRAIRRSLDALRLRCSRTAFRDSGACGVGPCRIARRSSRRKAARRVNGGPCRPRSICSPAMTGGGERGYARRRGPTERRDPDARPRLQAPVGWKRPAARRVRAIRDRLRELYGPKANDPHGDPIHELVLTILSQNTNDNNRDVAYRGLRDSFGDWDAVRDAPTSEVIEAIRPGGLANTKAPRIQEVLRELGPDPDLDWLETRAAAGRDRLPHGVAGRRAQDGRLRDDLRLRPPRDPGRHARAPRRRPARAVSAGPRARAGARRDARRSPIPPMPTSCT